MGCTDALAGAWMARVVGPALAGDGVYKPLETLRAVARVDWAAEGVCAACVRVKRAEWREEARDIWGRVDVWLGLGGEDAQKTV